MRLGRIDAGLAGQSQSEHLALGARPLITNAWKFTDREPAVVIDHRAFGPQSAQRGSARPEIGQIGLGLGISFNGAGRRQELGEFNQRRRSSAALVDGAVITSVFALEPKRADAADVVDRQKIVHRIQRSHLHRIALAARLPTLGVIALNDSPSPTVWLRVGNGGVEHRAVASLAVKLRTGDEGQAGLDGEALAVCKPCRIIPERGAFPRALLVVAHQAERLRLLSQINGDDPSHNG